MLKILNYPDPPSQKLLGYESGVMFILNFDAFLFSPNEVFFSENSLELNFTQKIYFIEIIDNKNARVFKTIKKIQDSECYEFFFCFETSLESFFNPEYVNLNFGIDYNYLLEKLKDYGIRY